MAFDTAQMRHTCATKLATSRATLAAFFPLALGFAVLAGCYEQPNAPSKERASTRDEATLAAPSLEVEEEHAPTPKKQDEQLPPGLKQAWLDVRLEVTQKDGVFLLPTHQRSFSTTLDQRGTFSLSPKKATKQNDVETQASSTLTVSLAGWGRTDSEKQPLGKAKSRASGNRVDVAHGHGLTEWYVNKSGGVEHGFTLAKKPEGDKPLVFTMRLDGGEVSEGGASALAVKVEGETLFYRDLKVWDANDTPLQAALSKSEGGFSITVDDTAAHYPITVDPTWTQQQKLTVASSDLGDTVGVSASLSGDHAILGSWHDNEDTGSAHIFERDANGTWTYRQTLTADDSNLYDQFGYSVGIDGAVIIVGAPADDDNGTQSGSAYVFERDANGAWTQQQKLTTDDGAVEHRFGRSVSIQGGRAVIGANGSGLDNSRPGSAYIFEQDANGTWTQRQKLTADDGEARDGFGHSVSISGDRTIVGVPLDDDNGDKLGSAYIFEQDANGTWTQQQKLTADDGAADDEFGHSVSIAGDFAIVGAPLDDDGADSSGSAYIFERDGSGNWSQLQKITASDGDRIDLFGYSVSISERFATVGAIHDDDNGIYSGSVYIFSRDGAGVWSQIQKLIASDGEGGDNFGWNVSLSENTLLVSAPSDSDIDTSSGAAYIFELPPNQAPIARDGTASTNEDEALSSSVMATDGDEDDVSYTIVMQPSNGSVIITDPLTGAYTYTPNPDFNGNDAFTFVASDGIDDSNEATVSVTVNAVNDAPFFIAPTPEQDAVIEVTAGEMLTITLAAEDVDGDTLTFGASSTLAGLSVDSATGVITATTSAQNVGDVMVMAEVTDGEASDTRAFMVRVVAGDTDSNGDGLTDAEKEAIGLDPGSLDSDDDFISDAFEVGEDAENPLDTDGDGTIDALDDDSDEDGVSDADEAGDEDVATDPIDTDGDGTPDFRDLDSDDDEVGDADDNCRIVENADQVDTDGDGIGDACDEDGPEPADAKDDDEDDGCGCETAAPAPRSPWQAMMLASLLGVFFFFRRKRPR